MDRNVDRRSVLRMSALAMVGLAGCSGGNGGGGTETPTDDATPTATATGGDDATATATATQGDDATPTQTDDATPTATPTDAGTATPQPDQRVKVGAGGDLKFGPKSFTISTGDTVLWEWVDPGHNVSPASQPSGADWPGDDATTYGEGHTHVYTFETAGDYAYHCDPHRSLGMEGSFTVE